MPRTPVLGPTKRKYKWYDEESMQLAIAKVTQENWSIKKASECYKINRTTLMNHIKNIKCKPVGHPTVLSQKEEELLVHALIKLSDWGFGFDRIQLRQCVLDFVKRMDKPNPFKGGLPGIDWCRNFENRWKAQLSRRSAQNLPKNRAEACSVKVMDDFFDKLKTVVTKTGLQYKPQNVFNCDETGFETNAGNQKILCRKGSRNPHKLVGNVQKAMYTVLVCCSAAGDYLPLFVNYKGLHLYSNWCQGGPINTRYNCSPSGWMEAPQFMNWFEKVFIASTNHLEGPKLLIFDGHNSHLSVPLIDIAIASNIELLCLPAHTSHLLQPLDVAVYKGVKQAWRSVLKDFYTTTKFRSVDKTSFPSLLKKLQDTGCFSRVNAVSGFEASGIYPLNKEKVMKKINTSLAFHDQEANNIIPGPSVAISEALEDMPESTEDVLQLVQCSLLNSLKAVSSKSNFTEEVSRTNFTKRVKIST